MNRIGTTPISTRLIHSTIQSTNRVNPFRYSLKRILFHTALRMTEFRFIFYIFFSADGFKLIWARIPLYLSWATSSFSGMQNWRSKWDSLESARYTKHSFCTIWSTYLCGFHASAVIFITLKFIHLVPQINDNLVISAGEPRQ